MHMHIHIHIHTHTHTHTHTYTHKDTLAHTHFISATERSLDPLDFDVTG
jgi:hypothetical protein